MLKGNVLILEDDVTLANELKSLLNSHGLHCTIVSDGALLFKENLQGFGLFILDINVPSFDGIKVCKRIRESDQVTPVLMLTAFGAISDKVLALGEGADDYLVKPFHFSELLARIQALLRRAGKGSEEQDVVYRIDDLVINTTQMRVERGGREIKLTPKEYKLLELLALSNGRVVSKQVIASKVWDINFDVTSNTIEVYVNFLRGKIDKEFNTKLIQTKPGYGYCLKQNG